MTELDALKILGAQAARLSRDKAACPYHLEWRKLAWITGYDQERQRMIGDKKRRQVPPAMREFLSVARHKLKN